MPLINCPACEAEVSADAMKCVKCGHVIKKPERSLFGKICKWTFIVFNVLMLVWLVGGVGAAGEGINTATTEAEKAGAAIGTALGAGLIIFLWVAGDIILGLFVLFTRPKAS